MDSTQNIISFCTGYGGIELGLRRAGVDVRVVCNVEIEAFVQANLVAKIHAGPPAPEKSSTSGKNHGSPKLNPNWVEQLMGLPIGWTDLGSWGMESSLKPQN